MKNNLKNILDEFDSFINSLEKTESKKLISFAFSIENLQTEVEISSLLNHYEKIFLFQTPDKKRKSIGIESVLRFQKASTKKFSELNSEFNFWRENFNHNWEEAGMSACPLIFCAAKFDPDSSSQDWAEYDPIDFYVPQFILNRQTNFSFGLYNFILNQEDKLEHHREILKEFLSRINSSIVPKSKTNLDRDLNISNHNDENLLEWQSFSREAIKLLNNGELEKLVLSRYYKFDTQQPIDWDSILAKLYTRFPDCYLFFIKKNNSVFFGSSPEMFLKISDKNAEVESVAGSAARGDRSESDYEFEKFLHTSEKNQREHSIVSEFITDILIKYSDNVRVTEEKQIRKLDNIQHLITKFSAELNSDENIFELIDSLFPTPAVCGVPKNKAMKLIQKLETYDRGLYSGLVGFFDFNGDCELAVSIRSALAKDNKLTAFAGAGLVKDSNPDEEFQETNLKLKTILSLFADENKS
jgi:menaquinone-specific isochorismate synthase